MHKNLYRWLISACVLFACVGLDRPIGAAQVALETLPYPSALAMSSDRGKWIYKSFPALLPLYIFDGEPEGTSLCDKTCSAVWPIIAAEKDDKPMGLWSVVKRDDGRFQWAFKNKPVYTYFEDSPDDARGVGKNMDWYLDEGAIAYLRNAGVILSAEELEAARRKGGDKKTRAVLLPPLN
jgi:predicted lipoprotein with Yx(FWY)xxD motif